MSWTTNCAMSPIALAPSCPNTPRVSDRGAVRHRTPEISPSRPTSGISTHLDAMRPLPSSRTLRTLALNARCTPSATPALSASTTTSSSGELSTTPGKETSGVSLICMSTSWLAIFQRNADFGAQRAGDDSWKIETMTV